MSPHYTNIQEGNPSDGHAFRASVSNPHLCVVCHSWPDEHACDTCGERRGDHTGEMRAKCARGGRVPDCYTCGAKGSESHDHDPVLQRGERQVAMTYIPPTCAHCGGIGHRQNDHDVHIHPASERLGAVILAHAAELRAMVDDLRDHLGPIGSPGYISRSARAEAYDEVAKRLERDARG